MDPKPKYRAKQQTEEIVQLKKQLKLFPQFGQSKFQQLPKLIEYVQKKFPWGCQQLQSQFVCNQQSVGYCLFYNDEKNLGISLKYGIISSTAKAMKSIAMLYKQKQNNCFIFLGIRKYLCAIAKIISYQPDKSFKYWAQINTQRLKHDPYGQANNVSFSGIFKFLKIGIIEISQRPADNFISAQEINELSLKISDKPIDKLFLQKIFTQADKAQMEVRKKEIQFLRNSNKNRVINGFNKGFDYLSNSPNYLSQVKYREKTQEQCQNSERH